MFKRIIFTTKNRYCCRRFRANYLELYCD